MAQPDAPVRAVLPDPSASRVVLIGVSEYRQMEPLPAVAANVAALNELFTAPDIWGVAASRCTVLLNPRTVDEVLGAVHDAARDTTDTLAVYFAGHGLLDDRFELYLGLPDSSVDTLHRAVRYDDLRRELVSTGVKCRAKVAILDCCYSGRAMLGGMGDNSRTADQARIEGTYLMTASAENARAMAPVGDKFTAFTGALVRAIAEGLPTGPDLLGMETLYWHLRSELQSRRLPVPQQRARNDGRDIALARNRRGRSGVQVAARRIRELPEAPVEDVAFLRRPPHEILARVRQLSADEPDRASRLLLAAAARRPDQEVAAMLTMVERSEVETLCLEAIVLRPPAEVATIVEALAELGSEPPLSALLRSAASRPADEVAELALALRDTHQSGALATLLQDSLAAFLPGRRMIVLVGALSVAGLHIELDHLLRQAAEQLTGSDAADLGDELHGAGLAEAAFRLYANVIPTIAATRDAGSIARLAADLRQAGRVDDASRLAAAAASGRDTPEALLALLSELWALDLNEDADGALTEATATSPVGFVVAVAAELRELGRAELAQQLCTRVSLSRPVAVTVELAASLRAAGRPIDANRLITAAAQRGLDDVTALVALLDPHSGDRQRLLAAVPDSVDIAQVITEVGRQGTDRDRLLHLVSVGDPYHLRALLETVSSEHAREVFDAVAAKAPLENLLTVADNWASSPKQQARLTQLMMAVGRAGNPTSLAELLVRCMQQEKDVLPDAIAVVTMIRMHPRLAGVLLDQLQEAHIEERAPQVGVLLAQIEADLVRLPPGDHIVLLAQLRVKGHARAHASIVGAIASNKPIGGLTLLIRKLHEAQQGKDIADIVAALTASPNQRTSAELADVARLVQSLDAQKPWS